MKPSPSQSTKKLETLTGADYALGDALRTAKRDYRLLGVIGVSFCIAILVVLYHTYRESNGLVRHSSLESARLYSEALAAFRTLYSSEVVSRAKGAGIHVTHDYHHQPNAIPLPATLSMELGELIGVQRGGATTRLFSDYPFPWRSDGGAQDEFEKRALQALRKNPERPYYDFETVNGRPALRYATADIMHSSCVNCHNSHPESPYRKWEAGDVRGVLAVNLPIEATAAYSRASLTKSFLVLAVLSATGLSGLAIVLKRHRKSASLLYDNNQRLSQVNSALHLNQKELNDSIAIQSHQYRELTEAKQQADGPGS